MCKVADALGVSLDELRGDKDEVNTRGKPEEIQDILSFIHLQQETYLAVNGVDRASKESTLIH